MPLLLQPRGFREGQDGLATEEWRRVLTEARAMGATQLGFSGGEPLVRRDLETLIAHARALGYYTNLITLGLGMDEARVQAFRDAGLDHIQLSFQSSEKGRTTSSPAAMLSSTSSPWPGPSSNRAIRWSWLRVPPRQHRLHRGRAAARGRFTGRLCGACDHPVLRLGAPQPRPPSANPAQLEGAQAIAHDYQVRYQGRMKIYYVSPRLLRDPPQACMNGWGAVFLTIAPDGTALPCHAARELPGIAFPSDREHDIAWIWNESPAFNRFRGFDWMKEPCRTCPERFKDFGGCRCQAYLLTGDAENADPVCDLSPHHDRVLAAIEQAAKSSPAASEAPLVFRNTRSSRAIRAARPE